MVNLRMKQLDDDEQDIVVVALRYLPLSILTLSVVCLQVPCTFSCTFHIATCPYRSIGPVVFGPSVVPERQQRPTRPIFSSLTRLCSWFAAARDTLNTLWPALVRHFGGYPFPDSFMDRIPELSLSALLHYEDLIDEVKVPFLQVQWGFFMKQESSYRRRTKNPTTVMMLQPIVTNLHSVAADDLRTTIDWNGITPAELTQCLYTAYATALRDIWSARRRITHPRGIVGKAKRWFKNMDVSALVLFVVLAMAVVPFAFQSIKRMLASHRRSKSAAKALEKRRKAAVKIGNLDRSTSESSRRKKKNSSSSSASALDAHDGQETTRQRTAGSKASVQAQSKQQQSSRKNRRQSKRASGNDSIKAADAKTLLQKLPEKLEHDWSKIDLMTMIEDWDDVQQIWICKTILQKRLDAASQQKDLLAGAVSCAQVALVDAHNKKAAVEPCRQGHVENAVDQKHVTSNRQGVVTPTLAGAAVLDTAATSVGTCAINSTRTPREGEPPHANNYSPSATVSPGSSSEINTTPPPSTKPHARKAPSSKKAPQSNTSSSGSIGVKNIPAPAAPIIAEKGSGKTTKLNDKVDGAKPEPRVEPPKYSAGTTKPEANEELASDSTKANTATLKAKGSSAKAASKAAGRPPKEKKAANGWTASMLGSSQLTPSSITRSKGKMPSTKDLDADTWTASTFGANDGASNTFTNTKSSIKNPATLSAETRVHHSGAGPAKHTQTTPAPTTADTPQSTSRSSSPTTSTSTPPSQSDGVAQPLPLSNMRAQTSSSMLLYASGNPTPLNAVHMSGQHISHQNSHYAAMNMPTTTAGTAVPHNIAMTSLTGGGPAMMGHQPSFGVQHPDLIQHIDENGNVLLLPRPGSPLAAGFEQFAPQSVPMMDPGLVADPSMVYVRLRNVRMVLCSGGGYLLI